jgi:hypothetical protein
VQQLLVKETACKTICANGKACEHQAKTLEIAEGWQSGAVGGK